MATNLLVSLVAKCPGDADVDGAGRLMGGGGVEGELRQSIPRFSPPLPCQLTDSPRCAFISSSNTNEGGYLSKLWAVKAQYANDRKRGRRGVQNDKPAMANLED